MTRHVWTAIECDDESCSQVFVSTDARALPLAKQAGWVRVRPAGRGYIDLCPAHKNGRPS